MNTPLIKVLADSIKWLGSIGLATSERKFKDMLTEWQRRSRHRSEQRRTHSVFKSAHQLCSSLKSRLAVADVSIEVVFAPKMYGKVLKGLLVLDTIDAQYLFDVFGKTPEYVPPVVKRAHDDIVMRSEPDQKAKRNIVKENIEKVKSIKLARRAKSGSQALLRLLG
jgi:hypothetical protein